MYGDSRGRKVGYVLPTGFSAGLYEVLTALLDGGTLYRKSVSQDGMLSFSSWLREEEIEHLYLIGPLFRTWLGTLHRQVRYPALRTFNIGGDVVNTEDLLGLRLIG